MRNIRKLIHLEVWCERVGELEGLALGIESREGRENQVTELNARLRDDVAERKVELAEELWEIV